ncbi:MAG: D-hexose-6-phosphate mutarotase [Acidobacteria bacterium]|nr:D-hexose-6-phosphate mutarotase [Acidobacteriota bacterium]
MTSSPFAKVVPGRGGLPRVVVDSPVASGEMYLHGGQVTSWAPAASGEVLFVSEQARWEDGRAIRGGIPICFPWFGAHATDAAAPSHGFVRTSAWQLEDIASDAGGVTVTMATGSTAETKRRWPADFRLVARAVFGSIFTLDLTVTNTGAAPCRFEEALHTYYRVGRIDAVRVRGLDRLTYLDALDAGRRKPQPGDVVFDSEVDRIYLDAHGDVDIVDDALGRDLRVRASDSRTTVVWNPWIEKARRLADLGDAEWRQFVCVETCNVAPFPVELSPGRQHTMRLVIEADPRRGMPLG